MSSTDLTGIQGGQAPGIDFSSIRAAGAAASQGPSMFDGIREAGRVASEEATGLEFAGIQSLSVGKSFVDAMLNVFGLAVKAGGGLTNMAMGGEYGEGYEKTADSLEQTFGDRDPDILDVIQRARGGEIIGNADDEYFRKRLGKWAFVGETIGHLASFASGPVALVGKGTKVVQPLGRLTERIYAKTLGQKIAGGVATARDSERVWNYVANTPKWRQALAKAGQTYLGDTVSTTAALMAQSYATAPDDERLNAAKAAATMGWLMVPVARVGERAAEVIQRAGLNPTQAQAIHGAVLRHQAGEIGLKQLDAIIKANVPMSQRALANYVVAPAAESLSLMLPDRHARELLWKGLGGDTDAAAEAFAIWLGTAGGLAAAKGLVPHNLAPLFKTYRPDANKLSLYLEAQANREVKTADPQDPVKVAALDPKTGEVVAPKAESNYAAWDRARKEWIDTLDVMWAEVPADAAIKGGWEPVATSSGVLELRYSPNYSARMKRIGTTGEMELVLGPKERKLLSDIGVDLPEGTLGDQAASVALESLTMLGMLRRLTGDVAFQKMGLRELEPGVYADNNGTQVRIDLDGKVLERDQYGGPWQVSKNQTLDYGVDMANAKWESPTGALLANMLVQKQAMSPDPLVDGILTYVLAEAQAGNSVGAGEIRKFLEQTNPDDLIASIKPGTDRQLAMELGRIAMGHDNSQAASQRRQEALQGALVEVALQDAAKAEVPAEGATGAEAGSLLVEPIVRGLVKTADAMVETRDFLLKPQSQRVAEAVPESDFAATGRAAEARGAELFGETGRSFREAKRAGRKAGKEGVSKLVKAEEMGMPAEEETYVSRGRMLADLKVEPKTKAEEAMVKAIQAALRTDYQRSQEAGTMRMQGGEMVPLPDAKQSVVPYEAGKDQGKVMADNELRPQFFDYVARANPDVMVPETKTVKRKDGTEMKVPVYEGSGKNKKPKMRQITGEDLEARFQENLKKQRDAGVEAKNLDIQQATEFTREFRNRPDVWRGYEVLEPNVLKAVDNVLRKQSAATAIHETFGQDVPNREAVMASLKKRVEADPTDTKAARSLEMLTNRPGVKDALRRFGDLANKTAKSTDDAKAAIKLAADWVTRIQKGEPVKLNKFDRWMRKYSIPTSMMMAWKAGLYDIPESFLRGASVFPVVDAIKAVWEVARSPAEAIRYAEDLGAILRESGDVVIQEAPGGPLSLQKIADLITIPSALTEKFKGAVMTNIANRMIARIRAGEATAGDIILARDYLRMTPEQVAAIKSGEVSDSLATQLRRESVTFTTSRLTSSEGSSFSADPHIASWLRYTKFAMARAESVLKTIHAVFRAKTKREFGRAAVNLTKTMSFLTISGAAAQALSFMLAETFRNPSLGAPIEGFKMYWNQLRHAPGYMLGKALGSQIIGGPLATAATALFDVNDARTLWNATIPTQAARALAMGVEGLSRGDWSAAWTMLVDSGLMPAGREIDKLTKWGVASVLGSDMEALADDRMLSSFQRLEGIESGSGPKTHPEEFYAAMRRTMRILRGEGEPMEKMDKAFAEVRKALDVAPEESVGAAIDAQRRFSRMSPEDQAKFIDFISDDERVRRITAREALIHNFASAVRKMEGTEPGEWESELALTKRVAVLGEGGNWNDLVDRALEETVQRRKSGEGEGSQLRELAEAMAPFQDQWGQVFSEDQIKRLTRQSDSSTRARMIYGLLRRRVVDRQKRKD